MRIIPENIMALNLVHNFNKDLKGNMYITCAEKDGDVQASTHQASESEGYEQGEDNY